MFRLVILLLVIAIVAIAIIRYKKAAKVIEVHGQRKRSKSQILENLKRGYVILREEDRYLLIQDKERFILWIDDDKWGEREFQIAANGNYKKSFTLSDGGRIRLIVLKGEVRLQQNDDEIVYPVV